MYVIIFLKYGECLLQKKKKIKSIKYNIIIIIEKIIQPIKLFDKK